MDSALINSCPLCVAPRLKLDAELLRDGVAVVLARYRMDNKTEALLKVHLVHVERRGPNLARQPISPAPDVEADPISKARWVQQVSMREVFVVDEVQALVPADEIGKSKQRLSALSTVLSAVKVEGEQSGQPTGAALRAKRQAERELAREEAHEEEVLSREEQLRLYAATLRLHGYDVSRDVTIDAGATDGDSKDPPQTGPPSEPGT
jgi:hypothetical protein